MSDYGEEMKFSLVDEIVDEAGDGENEAAHENGGKFDLDISEDELDKLLDEGLPEEFRKKRKRAVIEGNDGESSVSQRFTVEEKCPHHNIPMPEGWIPAYHACGLKVYLHRESRVCTVSRPYFLGPASFRKHNIPLCAIPCLQYRSAKEEERSKTNKYEMNSENMTDGETSDEKLSEKKTPGDFTENGGSKPDSKNGAVASVTSPEQKKLLERLLKHSGSNRGVKPDISKLNVPVPEDICKTYAVTPEQVREYCSKLMDFRQYECRKFKTWQDRRNFTRKERGEEMLDVPTGPSGKRVYRFQIAPESNTQEKGRKHNKEWIMNPNGKSYICILHEYTQHIIRKLPKYEFSELENSSSPYGCTVSIDNVKYGAAQGASKKIAKLEAAKKALEILIPQMQEFIKETEGSHAPKLLSEDLSFFDNVLIEDPRVADLSTKVSEPTPYPILLTCIQRNYGLCETNIEFKMHSLKPQKNEAEMTVGKHTVRVRCKSKKDGKQLASQAILKAMHPHVKTWGSILRLYGNQSLKPLAEKRALEKGITVLQGKAVVNEPNFAILEKLKLEMEKLHRRKEEFKPIGTFSVAVNSDTPSFSASDLKSVDF